MPSVPSHPAPTSHADLDPIWRAKHLCNNDKIADATFAVRMVSLNRSNLVLNRRQQLVLLHRHRLRPRGSD